MARTDDLQQCLADVHPRVLQRDEVDARDDEVAPQRDRIDRRHAGQRRDHRQVLVLDQRDLARRQLGLAALAEPIVRQADAGQRLRGVDAARRPARVAAHDDRFDTARHVRRLEQVADRLHRWPARGRLRGGVRHSSSIHTGAWSLDFSQPRTSRSTAAARSRGTSGGLSRKWSMRSPALRS